MTAVTRPDLGRLARTIADEVVAPAANDVDRRARFPKECLDALREHRLLAATVPEDLGGMGASLSEMVDAVAAVSSQCASSGMVYAMHLIQVACMVRHGHTPFFRAYLRDEVADRQALLASATTEVGTGGDVRTSGCAVIEEHESFKLEKQAPVISYGEYADAVLATARRAPDSPPSDQVLVLCRPPALELEPFGEWDTLGFRGTCSRGFTLRAFDSIDAILPDPYGDISSMTMLPHSHVLWGSVWLGLADGAIHKAHAFVRGAARAHPGSTPPAAIRLAELMSRHQQLDSLVRSAARRCDTIGKEASTGMDFAMQMNSLKVAASSLVVEIVSGALLICGMAGYREDSDYSMGRLLRDAYGAGLMVNNDRILGNSAQLLLVLKDG
jgi:acyl-CoA dehydrogenase